MSKTPKGLPLDMGYAVRKGRVFGIAEEQLLKAPGLGGEQVRTIIAGRSRTATEPPARQTRNRLIIRNGIVTLLLNGDAFSVPLDETNRLDALCPFCDQLGEGRLEQQLKAIIEEASQPLPRPA